MSNPLFQRTPSKKAAEARKDGGSDVHNKLQTRGAILVRVKPGVAKVGEDSYKNNIIDGRLVVVDKAAQPSDGGEEYPKAVQNLEGILAAARSDEELIRRTYIPGPAFSVSTEMDSSKKTVSVALTGMGPLYMNTMRDVAPFTVVGFFPPPLDPQKRARANRSDTGTDRSPSHQLAEVRPVDVGGIQQGGARRVLKAVLGPTQVTSGRNGDSHFQGPLHPARIHDHREMVSSGTSDPSMTDDEYQVTALVMASVAHLVGGLAAIGRESGAVLKALTDGSSLDAFKALVDSSPAGAADEKLLVQKLDYLLGMSERTSSSNAKTAHYRKLVTAGGNAPALPMAIDRLTSSVVKDESATKDVGGTRIPLRSTEGGRILAFMEGAARANAAAYTYELRKALQQQRAIVVERGEAGKEALVYQLP